MRRLQIELSLITEAYEQHELTDIFCIAGQNNPANDLTKADKRVGMLARIMELNHFMPKAQSPVRRDFNAVMPQKRVCPNECFHLKKKNGGMS